MAERDLDELALLAEETADVAGRLAQRTDGVLTNAGVAAPAAGLIQSPSRIATHLQPDSER